jgi:predicted ATPase/DNA-binding SARP family transcriptional activator
VSACEIRLFGTPAVMRQGTAQPGLRSKSLALLAYLVVEDRPIARDTAATLLWPDCGQAAARRNLRTCLFEIKHALPKGAVITEGDALRLSALNLQIDLREFLQIPEQRPCAEQIIRCCPAGFMEGFTLEGCLEFDNWQTLTSEKLQRRLETLLAAAVQELIRAGEAPRAIPHCQRLVSLDPLEEASHRLMMRVYAACGHWAAAERQYRTCRAILREELGAAPHEETEELARAVVQQAPELSSFEAREAMARVPAEVSEFFGRVVEIQQVEDRLVSGDARLLTLTGPAGAGKTRLAIRVAHRLRDRFPDGVAFADLTGAGSPGQALAIATGAIGMRQQIVGGQTQAEILARHLSGRRMLVVLDNFEHVLRAASKVAVLIRSTTDVRILATSREPLGIRGEAVIEVRPFEIPESVEVTEIADSPVIQLLVDRARLADPAFRLTAENAWAMRDLCAALDGLPLAIELAIPLLRVYSPGDLVSRLRRPLRVLRTGGADRPVRHRSLEKAIDWSYDLLDEDQRALFCALSVFAKGFDLAAVEHVCRVASKTPAERLLQALVEKSLVQQRRTPVGLRFELLESTREYAEQRGESRPGRAELRSRHADHYRSLSLQGEVGMRGPDQIQWFDALTLASGNTTLALAHLDETEQWEAGLEMACAMGWYWYRSGQFGFGVRWLDTFLSRCPDTPSGLRARGLHLKGWLTFVQGDWRTAHRLYGESLYMARQVSNGPCECRALADLGVVERWLGNRPRGWDYALKAVEVARTLDDADLLSRTLIWAYATTGGAFVDEPPLRELEEAAALARRTGNDWIHAHAYNGLGDLCKELGQLDRACQAYQTALEGFRRLEDRYLSAWTLEGLGQVEMQAGNRKVALEHTVEALALFDGLGDELDVAVMLARVVVMAREERKPGELALIAGAASVLLEHQCGRGLSGAPQVAEAVGCLKDLGLEQTAGWLRGRTATRAAAVAAAKRLCAGGAGADRAEPEPGP